MNILKGKFKKFYRKGRTDKEKLKKKKKTMARHLVVLRNELRLGRHYKLSDK